MAYIRPKFFVRRVFNPLAMRFGIGGATTLTVPGRRTGTPRRVPVIPVEHEGARYVVSTRGEADWVQNLRAGGRVELTRGGKSEELAATEIPVEQRPPIIEKYRQVAGKTVVPYWKQLPDAADHPVFRLDAR